MAGATKPEPTIVLVKAHDVRRLRGCDHCGCIGDDRYMPEIPNGKTVHGICALELLGEEGLTRLPDSEQRKLTLGEIGVPAMKRLVDAFRIAREKRRSRESAGGLVTADDAAKAVETRSVEVGPWRICPSATGRKCWHVARSVGGELGFVEYIGTSRWLKRRKSNFRSIAAAERALAKWKKRNEGAAYV